MKLTINELNKRYKEYLKYPIINGKDRFGWYSATLINGKLAIGSTLKDLEECIKDRIK